MICSPFPVFVRVCVCVRVRVCARAREIFHIWNDVTLEFSWTEPKHLIPRLSLSARLWLRFEFVILARERKKKKTTNRNPCDGELIQFHFHSTRLISSKRAAASGGGGKRSHRAFSRTLPAMSYSWRRSSVGTPKILMHIVA